MKKNEQSADMQKGVINCGTWSKCLKGTQKQPFQSKYVNSKCCISVWKYNVHFFQLTPSSLPFAFPFHSQYRFKKKKKLNVRFQMSKRDNYVYGWKGSGRVQAAKQHNNGIAQKKCQQTTRRFIYQCVTTTTPISFITFVECRSEPQQTNRHSYACHCVAR